MIDFDEMASVTPRDLADAQKAEVMRAAVWDLLEQSLPLIADVAGRIEEILKQSPPLITLYVAHSMIDRVRRCQTGFTPVNIAVEDIAHNVGDWWTTNTRQPP
jgi:hypothetical protein